MRGEDRLDRLLSMHFRRDPDAGANEHAAARVLAALAKALPPQRRSLRHWPAALLRWDLSPAWPRVAALAGCAVIGFAVGAISPSLHGGDTRQTRGDFQLASILSEPEVMTGGLP